MALINCPECGKEISDKAISCPNCGVPLSKEISQLEKKNEEQMEILPFPNLPENLDIGRQITNWAFDAAFEGFFDGRENTLSVIPSGKVTVLLHTHGIELMSGLNFYPIHNSQIISLKTVSQEELVKTDKSVIGRAVVGGLILGPLGAIVGGMSGIGSKEKFINKQYFIINFWDTITQSAQSILISSTEGTKINSFIARQAKENSLNITDNREPEPNTMLAWAIICIIVIIISVIIIIAS
ncbi:MAG TPA: zinc ribbon domain-containing protein [Bacteroidales bacterium]|nr:zinc ribbon domain-containing protein [Bacteroidales bacterium]